MGGLDTRGPSWPNRFRDDRDPVPATVGYGAAFEPPAERKGGSLSVRSRVLLPVVIALLGTVVLGLVQVASALNASAQANRARPLAGAAGTVSALVHNVGAEFVLANQVRRGTDPSAAARLVSQRRATDESRTEFASSLASIRAAAPALAGACDAAERALAGLATARNLVPQSPDGSTEVRAFYDGILVSLLGLADALTPQLADTRLIELSRSVTAFAQLDRLATLQLDLIGRALTTKQLGPSDPTELAQWVGAEQAQVETLRNLHPGGDFYDDLVRQSSVADADSIRQIVLDGRGVAASLETGPSVWDAAQGQRVSGLYARERQLAGALLSDAVSLGVAARNRALLIGALSAVVVAATLASATILAARISRRLRRTRQAALAAARFELPNAIANVIDARDATRVSATLAESSDRIEAMLEPGSDEIGELSAAFGAVHQQALRLAADQAMLRMEVQAMFVALSRRGQTLIQRQIQLIDEFGRDESDPGALSRLFALDHLAARMRRNEENLLVLAGGEPGRWITRPVALMDLVRAAAQEIEAYLRVDIVEAAPVAIAAPVAGDTIHLLAELLENATSFSAPNTRVRVAARRTFDGLTITVADDGIGMPTFQVAQVNERLSRPSGLTSTLVGTMGLLVVARLAQRQGIQVHLDAAPASGTVATVSLPDRHIMALSTVDRLQPGRWLRDGVPMAPGLPPMPGPGIGAGVHYGGPGAVAASPRGAAGSVPPSPPPGVPAQRPSDHIGQPGTPRAAAPSVPDPESVRARLSSLSRGIEAAQRGDPMPPSL